MRRKSQLHVKVTQTKGREYCYFRTGKKNAQGREILVPLPPRSDLAGFGAAYASCLAARARRDAAVAELTVPALIDLYERSDKFRRLSAGTKRVYGFALDYIRKMLPTAPAGLLERSDVARLIDGRAEQPGAANTTLRVLNTLYKWGRSRGHVTNDPGRDVGELALGEHEPWPAHILEAGLSAEDDTVRLAVHLLYYLGQRIGDTLHMTGAMIRDDAITITQQKTGRTLTIQIHERLRDELARHDYGLGYIIPGVRPGKPLSQDSLRRRLQDFTATLGAKTVPHGLRKNAVNALLEAGCSVAETAAVSGQSLAMVEHYAKARAQGSLASAAILKWQGHIK
jgi:integrase